MMQTMMQPQAPVQYVQQQYAQQAPVQYVQEAPVQYVQQAPVQYVQPAPVQYVQAPPQPQFETKVVMESREVTIKVPKVIMEDGEITYQVCLQLRSSVQRARAPRVSRGRYALHW